jgi:predicted RNA-binding Zn ribbon-like protein
MAAIDPHRFKLFGGHPALDFVNTVRDWTAVPLHDYLNDFGDAVRFGCTAGFLHSGENKKSAGQEAELERLKKLRLLLKSIFESCVAGKSPHKKHLQELGEYFSEIARAMQLVPATLPSAFFPLKRVFPADVAGPALLRFRIINAAVELLISDAVTQIKACPSCRWFFVDTSKNHSRRWCSMQTCGSVSKASRYYHRRKSPR